MKTLTFCTFAFLILFQVSVASTILVPSQEPTIQAGIAASSEDDTVLVGPGTYTGEGNRGIDFGGKNLVLKSADGPQLTVIDCEGYPDVPVFYIHGAEDSTCVIEGFTITGADYCCDPGPPFQPPCGPSGGGVLCVGASPTLRGNIITGNNANAGGGVHLRHSSAIVIDNTIIGNSACCYFGGVGGGIYADSSDPSIVDNIIVENSTCQGDMGTSAGAGIYMRDCHGQLTGNTIARNISLSQLGTPLTGGLVLDNSLPGIDRCIFAYNGGYGCTVYLQTEMPLVTCCLSFGHEWSDDFPGVDFATDTLGNLCADPLFCDTISGDYQISGASPCAPDNNDCGALIGSLGPSCTLTDVEDDTYVGVPVDFELHQNYPNPFNPTTIIKFSLTERSHVTLKVFNILGQSVVLLVNREYGAGEYEAEWNGKSSEGQSVAAGIYFCRLTAGRFQDTKKMVVIR